MELGENINSFSKCEESKDEHSNGALFFSSEFFSKIK